MANMKSVTPLTVLTSVALVVFVDSMRLPCISFENPYQVLNGYLTDNIKNCNLKENIGFVKKMTDAETEKLLKHSDNFLILVHRFRELWDFVEYGEAKLCSSTVLSSLLYLVNEALDNDKNFMKEPKSNRRLNRLLINLVEDMRKVCYKSLQMKWDALDKREREFSSIFETPATMYFNSNVLKDDVFKRFIYRPKDTPKPTTLEDNRKFVELIRDALLANEGSPVEVALSSPYLKRATIKKHLNNYLTEPCDKLIKSGYAIEILEPAVYVLAIEMTVLPRRQEVFNQEEPKFKMDSMPAYVMCHELAKKRTNLISSLSKLLLFNKKTYQKKGASRKE